LAYCKKPWNSCNNGVLQIVESIPLQVDLKSQYSTYDTWAHMIQNAKSELLFGEFYFNLANTDVQDGGWMGTAIADLVKSAHRDRNVTVRVVQNQPNDQFPDEDTKLWEKMGIAEVRSINWGYLVGAGILHTKLIIADRKAMYLGSANTDWTSLAQVKEIGLYIDNCGEIVEDVLKIF